MDQPTNNYNFKEWDNYYLIHFITCYEEFSLTKHQINNLHIYYAAISELYSRLPEEKNYQYRHYYFTEENPYGTYLDYLKWRKENEML